MSSKSHPHRENTLLYALNKWESLHAQVSTLLGEYLVSCSTLEAFLRPPLRSRPNELDQAFTTIDAALAMLDQTNARIQKSSRILARVRNRSATRVPISTLPDEILVYVLSLAKPLCVIDYEPSISEPPLLNSLLCVSMHWYSLLIRTPWIWSHIDLMASGDDSIDKNYLVDAQHSLQRAGKTRLHVHIQVGRKPKDQALEQIIRLLIPHVNDITSLQIWFDSSPPVGQIFDSLFGYDYCGSLQEILLNGDGPPSVYIPDTLLQSLQVVNIRGASLSWNNRILSGLTEIHVDARCKASQLNISNIFTVLTGCPELRSLALIGIGSQVDFISVGTVHLSQLEFLDLRGMGPGLLPLFLSRLYPGQKKLGFSIDIISDNADTYLQEISNFMKRTTITRFCASFNPDLDQLPLDIVVSFISGNLPFLEALALEDYNFRRKRIEQTIAARCLPKLHTLHLLYCMLDKEAIQDILVPSLVQQIFVTSPRDVSILSSMHYPVERFSYAEVCDYKLCSDWPRVLD